MNRINTDRMVKDLCDFVKMPSESPNDQEFISFLEQLFKSEGARTQKDNYGNLVAKFNAKNSTSTKPIGFVCHADTVKPGIGINPIIDREKIKSDGTTILGGDDKAGIAEILEMVRTAEKHPPIEVIITRCEEIGPIGSANMDYSMIESKMAYVLDEDSYNGIVVGGPTIILMDVCYKGVPAHAGMAPEKGISSIIAASTAILRLKLGKLDEETTANVGTIHGGEVRNGIPEYTRLMAECRCLTHEKAIKLSEEMMKIFYEAGKETGTQVTIDKRIPLIAYNLPVESQVVKLAQTSLIKSGVKNVKIQIVRGGSDATHMNSHGIQTAVIGTGYHENHTCKEYVVINEMEIIARTLIDMVEVLA